MRSREHFNSSPQERATDDTATEAVPIHVVKVTRHPKSPEKAKSLVGNDMKRDTHTEHDSSQAEVKHKRRGTAEKIMTKREDFDAYVDAKEAEIKTLTPEQQTDLREALKRLKTSAEDLEEGNLTPEERTTHEKEFLMALKQLEARKRKGLKLVESIPEQEQAPTETKTQPEAAVEVKPSVEKRPGHEATPEAEFTEQLYRIFGEDTESWDRVRKTPAPFFLRQGVSASPAEATLKSYMRDLMIETGLQPRGRLLGFNETIEQFVIRALDKLYSEAR